MKAVAEQACAPRITSGHDVEPYSSWVRRARCAGRSAVFADDERAADAIEVCQRCPVLRQCRSWALLNAVDGVAGGMTADERTAWRNENGMTEPTLTVEDFVPAESSAPAPSGDAAGRRSYLKPSSGGPPTARAATRSRRDLASPDGP